MSKYRNKKTVINNIVFDSKLEALRYAELKMLEKARVIRDLELQPKFVLQESFRHNNKTHRAIAYIADFKYFDLEEGKVIVEDVKGFKTDVFKLKEKLFLYKYGGDLEFRLIK